jgi:hypothetical protein
MTEQERDAALLKLLTGQNELRADVRDHDEVLVRIEQKVDRVQERVDQVENRLSEVLDEFRDKGLLDDRPDDHDVHEATG